MARDFFTVCLNLMYYINMEWKGYLDIYNEFC